MQASPSADLKVAIVGATGGIGHALVNRAASEPSVSQTFALSRSAPATLPENCRHVPIDLNDEATIEAAAKALETAGPLDVVIVATGLLHEGETFQPEKDWRQLDAEDLARSFAINTIGPALVAKHFLPLMPKDKQGIFAALSARVGSISDNRIGGWYGYRASKSALNMIIRNLAIELRRKRSNTIAVGLHPGTVDTGLSKPFQSSTKPGQVVTPDVAADNLWRVIAGLGADDSGHVFAWDGSRIPA